MNIDALIQEFMRIEFLAGLAIGFLLCLLICAWPLLRALKARFLSAELTKTQTALDQKQAAYETLLSHNSALQTEKNALQEAREAMSNQFKVLSQEIMQNSLNQSSEQFLKLAGEQFKRFEAQQHGDMDKRSASIADMIKPVEKRLESLGAAVEQVKGTDQALREELKSLQQETSKIAGAMHNPAARGKWGEYILERLLEKSGLVKNVHFQLQASIQKEGASVLRPDVVIHLQDNLRIVVDSKAPIQDVLEDLQNQSHAEQQEAAQKMAAQVRMHIRDLSSKAYQDHFDSPDFVVLFLPAEHLFSMAVGADPALVDYAAERNIVLASPILILSILRVVRMSWQQNELTENAQEIAKAGVEMHQRLSGFAEHLSKLGKSMQGAINHYNGAIGSFERKVIPQARRFEGLHAASAKSLPDLGNIDTQAREILIETKELEEHHDEHDKEAV